MVNIYTLDQIRHATEGVDFAATIEAGFAAYSRGEVITPPVGELIFEDPPGDTHIKYGYIKRDDYFVIKVASGFYGNAQYNLPSSSGLMLVFSQKTGVLETVLLDEGYLTNVRTAVAGQISAKYLAPEIIHGIGVFGTGTMARMQVQYLKTITDCNRLIVWGRSDASLETYKKDMTNDGYDVLVTRDSDEVASECNLILMTTPSQTPLLNIAQVRPGTHITAMGSDTAEKQEIESEILAFADIVVADSLEQCQQRGEIFHAINEGQITLNEVIELGDIIQRGDRCRTSNEQVTVADLTGVAVQDIQIAKAVCAALSPEA